MYTVLYLLELLGTTTFGQALSSARMGRDIGVRQWIDLSNLPPTYRNPSSPLPVTLGGCAALHVNLHVNLWQLQYRDGQKQPE